MHVVRLRSIDLLEAQGLLVPGQGSTLRIWGFFAEDGEESSVVSWARRKEGRSGRAWMDVCLVTDLDAIPRSLADWRDAGCEFFLRLMSLLWC